ncbi:MAG: long-chain fatty acid--CoA ligase [bacterium]|nr:long-chain fatty acid--CoA ligase [bacterium]
MTRTILSCLDDHARNHPGATAYAAKESGEWRLSTWAEFRAQVETVGRALIALGLQPGDTVGILGFNRPEWTITCLGTMAAGGSPVGIYQTCSPKQVGYILQHAESRVVVVENEEQWQKVHEVRDELPALEHVVVMRGSQIPDVLGWDAFLDRGHESEGAALEERRGAIRGDQLASLIYTSGTTGTPKGVMLSHSNLVETARIADSLHGLGTEDSTLSYLPLAHIAEQMISVYLAIYSGFAVYYAESIDKLADNLREVKPTIFFGVPRVWERIHATVTGKLQTAPALRRRLATWSLDVGRRATMRRLEGGVPGGLLALQARLADKLVLSRVRDLLGLSRARLCASGAAPIRRDVLDFFASLGLVIYEVYGLSETSGPGTWNNPRRAKLGTVGPALPEVELEIAEDGEVLFKGPNVFLGYFRDPESTAEALEDGWFHTGDVGELDADGFLSITGRKKELIITSGGKNIAPTGIEAELKRIDLVGEAVVIGDARRFVSALITLEEEAAARFAAEHGGDTAALHESDQVRRALQEGVDGVNANLARVESVREFRVLPRSFSVDEGELTPTLKLRRREIEENWAELIEEMYG